MLDVTTTALEGVLILEPKRLGDARGFFSEVYNRARFADAGIDVNFVQDNHSRSALAGTLRGLHFQTPPMAQDKLVRVVRGRVLDVAVDLRRSSPTYGKHVAADLSAENWRQIFVPKGFAHGFITLTPDTEVVYKVSALFSPEHDLGLAYDDPDLAIAWPDMPNGLTLSDRDQRHPRLADLPAYFP
ncbi:MAG: dTDP-4-dehydrorhamnose 3,5-epimerase [Pseudomonadota bacterium]